MPQGKTSFVGRAGPIFRQCDSPRVRCDCLSAHSRPTSRRNALISPPSRLRSSHFDSRSDHYDFLWPHFSLRSDRCAPRSGRFDLISAHFKRPSAGFTLPTARTSARTERNRRNTAGSDRSKGGATRHWTALLRKETRGAPKDWRWQRQLRLAPNPRQNHPMNRIVDC